MLKLETLRSAHELDRLKSRWSWLEKQGSYSIFQSYQLNRLAAQWFAARESPHVIVAESDAGLAIIPAVRREREVGLIGETLFDYRDVLSAGDPRLLEHAWRKLATLTLPLEVTALRGPDVQERWSSFGPTEFCNAPTTRRCDITAEDFVASHRKAAKASRRLARQGLTLLRRDNARPECGFQQVVGWLYRRKAEWSGRSENLFSDKLRQDFMRHVVNSNACNCTIWSYETNYGGIAAALLTLQNGRFQHFYTIHHDPRWESFSPGQVMIFDVTRATLAEDLDVDFMTGEYPYKNRLATAMVPLYRVAASAAQMASWKFSLPGVVMPAA